MRIVRGSGGSFLCPPGHPMLTWHLESGRTDDPDLIAGLDYALKNEYGDVPAHIQAKVQALYDLATLVESEEWVKQVYGYFRNCYSPDGVERNVSKALIVGQAESLYPGHPLVESGERVLSEYSSLNRGPIVTADDPRIVPTSHLGYLYVRTHFPDHAIRLDLIENGGGYGTKKCSKCDKTLQYEAKVDAFAEAITCRTECPKGGSHVAH